MKKLLLSVAVFAFLAAAQAKAEDTTKSDAQKTADDTKTTAKKKSKRMKKKAKKAKADMADAGTK